jgi:hypothetical protein
MILGRWVFLMSEVTLQRACLLAEERLMRRKKQSVVILL